MRTRWIVLGLSLLAGSAHAQQKPPAKPAPKTNKPLRVPDVPTRRSIAGGPTGDDVAMGADSPELRALHEAEKELFPPAVPNGSPWPTELPSPMARDDERPRVHASGLPPAPQKSTPPASENGKDLTWLASLQQPDVPVRWDPRVVRYLEFFKDDPRGRSTFTLFYKRSGKYREALKRTLRRKSLPEDLMWVAMVESGFDPVIRSPVGALGLWQFMPETGKAYGLTQDRWLDQRLNVTAATEAAADFLGDLHRRFGSWELALAAYNMGYGGMMAIVRRFNTNDYWALSHAEGSLPWETTLYVPKIIAVSIVAKNLAAFGFASVSPDGAVEVEEVPTPPGTPLALVASACGCTPKELETLNPELRAGRTPPVEGTENASYPVKVPMGKGQATAQNLKNLRKDQAPLERYVVRFGETIEQIAQARRVPVNKLVEINGIGTGEIVRGGMVLLVPRVDPAQPAPPALAPQKQTVIVPSDVFVYPDRKRVFYRVLVGDTLREIATSLAVPVDDLRRWNNLDPTARLVEGMTLQAFVAQTTDLSKVVVMQESDVRVLPVGSEEFYAHLEQQKGYKRIVVVARAGETLETIGKRYNVPKKTMERINRKSGSEALKDGEQVVLYVAPNTAAQNHAVAQGGPQPNEKTQPPVPDLLPLPPQ